MMKFRTAIAALAFPLAALAQKPCAPVAIFQPCEITFELSESEARQNPNPYLTVEVSAEIRSPKYKTFLVPAFWDGGRRIVVRFAPDDPGAWTYRITGNIGAASGEAGTFQATTAEVNGYIVNANVHHWRWTETVKPHLWMGDALSEFATLDRAVFDRLVSARAKQKFTHLRGALLNVADEKRAFPAPDQPGPEYFREVESRIAAANQAGMVVDLVLGAGPEQAARLFPSFAARERWVRYLVARFASYNVTWQMAAEFESDASGRDLVKQLGLAMKKFDYYAHPRSSGAKVTSSPIQGDQWVNYIVEESPDEALGAIERQIFTLPLVMTAVTTPGSSDEAQRKALWHAAMNGLYPGFQGDPNRPDTPMARTKNGWFDFFSHTRWWDLEPYFDVEGGRALALQGIEYIVYLEKPGPVSVTTEKHGYNVYWVDPASGESQKEKEYKGELFQGEPPDSKHDWVLHLSRDGTKEGLRKEYKFESRRPFVQEVEASPAKLPFELEEPAARDLRVGETVRYSIKLKRETKASKAMLYVITGEVVRDAQGSRVLATGKEGTFRVPREIAKQFPAAMILRVYGLNGVGKAYESDTVITVNEP